VLKSTSSSDQWDVPLARFPYDLMGCLRIAVWAAWPNHDRRPRSGEPGGVTNGVGGHDPHLDGNPPMLRRVSERGEGRAVVSVICRQIYQNCDDEGAHQ